MLCALSHCNVQESSEEKTQQLKERLSRLFEANERRCSRRVLYGSDLLQACAVSSEPGHSALTAGGWRWVGRESCIRAQKTCVATASALQSTLLSVEERLEAANSLINRCLWKPPWFCSALFFESIMKHLWNVKFVHCFLTVIYTYLPFRVNDCYHPLGWCVWCRQL